MSSRVFPFVSGTKNMAKATTAEMNIEKIQNVQSCPSAATNGLKNLVTTKAIVQLKQAEQYKKEWVERGEKSQTRALSMG